MAFPKKILGICIGWSDRGELAPRGTTYIVCTACNRHIRMAIEKKRVFGYCPMCLETSTKDEILEARGEKTEKKEEESTSSTDPFEDYIEENT